MPGHKGSIKLKNLQKYDITEINGADYLLNSNGIIKAAEKKCSQIYGSKNTIFSTSGSTSCIFTMLNVLKKNYKINCIVAIRNCHISFINACVHNDIMPIWVYNNSEFIEKKIEKAIIENPNAGAVYITTPDYFGNVLDVKRIKEICKKYDKLLCVDNAHGAYLKFLEKDIHPISIGADICCDSAHKTLGVLTGGAYLHSNLDVSFEDLKQSMQLFVSTSPSYLTLTSLDLNNAYLEKKAKNDFFKLAKISLELKNLCKAKGVACNYNSIDIAKLVVYHYKIGYTDVEMIKHLKKYKIEPEFVSEGNTILMFSPFNKKKDFSRLKKAITNLKVSTKLISEEIDFILPEQVLDLRRGCFSDFEIVSTNDCINRISAQIVSKCPPGIPILIYGEKINQTHINILKRLGILEIKVIK